MRSEKTAILTEAAVMVALSVTLSFFKIWEAPLGGAVTLFSMVPVLTVGLRHGVRWGFAAAFVYSVTQLLLGLGFTAYLPPMGIVGCMLFDYIIAFSVLGFAGFFKIDVRQKKRVKLMRIFAGTLICCILRFLSHFLFGALVWYELTKAGGWNDYVSTVGMWTYSFVYNIQYMLPETVLALLATPIMSVIITKIKNPEKSA